MIVNIVCDVFRPFLLMLHKLVVEVIKEAKQQVDLVGADVVVSVGRGISKDAMRQKTADQYDALYVAALNVARTAKDFKNAAEILDMKVKVLGLDREDVQMLPKQVYARSWRVLSLDPESIGLAKADRRALKVMIDELTVTGLIPESERKRLDMDTGIIDYDIVERMEDESQAAN